MSETGQRITIEVEHGDALTFECDVLGLKYAQDIYGVDSAVVRNLAPTDVERAELKARLPKVSDILLIPTAGKLGAKAVLFIGVKKLWQFAYGEIRRFGRDVFVGLAHEAPDTRHLCLTISV